MGQGRYTDLSGKIFTRLLVIDDIGKRDRYRGVLWQCLCSCGQEVFVTTNNLVAGHVKSCGCLQREHISRLNAKYAKINGAKGCRNRITDPDSLKKTVYSQYKKNAKARGFLFELSFKDALRLFSDPCFYCGLKETNCIKRKTAFYKYNGIDRVDNRQSYTLDNAVSCCKNCNFSKGQRSQSDFLDWIASVQNHQDSLVVDNLIGGC